jgi:hypothetical protein
LSVAAGVGRISSRIGRKILPTLAPAGQSPGTRSRPPTSASATTATRPAVGLGLGGRHALTNHDPELVCQGGLSVSLRLLAAERGICGIAMLGEWRGSGQRPGITEPATTAGDDHADRVTPLSGTQLPGPVWVDLQASTITKTPRPTVGGLRPGLVVVAWQSGRRRGNTHGTGDGRPPTADCRPPTADCRSGTATR